MFLVRNIAQLAAEKTNKQTNITTAAATTTTTVRQERAKQNQLRFLFHLIHACSSDSVPTDCFAFWVYSGSVLPLETPYSEIRL